MAVAIIYSSGRTGRAAHAIPRTSLPLGLDTNMKEYFIANGFKIGKKGAKVRSFVRSFVRPGGRADGRRGRRQAAPMLHVEFMKSLLKRKGKFPNKPKRAEAAAAATTTQSVDDRKKLSSTEDRIKCSLAVQLSLYGKFSTKPIGFLQRSTKVCNWQFLKDGECLGDIRGRNG